MSNESTTEAVNSLEDIFVISANAIQSAIETHGDAAISMVMTIYRIEAIQSIIIGFIGIIGFAYLIYFTVKTFPNKIYPWVSKGSYSDDRELIYIPVGTIYIFVLFLFPIMSLKAFNIFYWVAVFGYPEVLITYKALISAGIM